MADQIAVKKTSEQTTNQETAVSKRSQNGLSKRGLGDVPLPWNQSGFSNPFALMRRLSEEMDRTFGRFLGREEGGEAFWSPAIEVSETGGQLTVHADLPGVKPEDVRVEVADDHLVIQGERKYEHEEKKKGVYRSERRYGQFYRAIPLPEGANTEQAKAQFKDGVLQVTLPIPEQKSNRREIPIESK